MPWRDAVRTDALGHVATRRAQEELRAYYGLSPLTPPKMRVCLRCDVDFTSIDGARVCPTCKNPRIRPPSWKGSDCAHE